jgi:hypothetical protein
MLKKPELFENGFKLTQIPLPEELKTLVQNEKWTEIDAIVKDLVRPGGSLFQFLLTYHEFSSIEFIISVRDSTNEWEEDGIWHDDGSRVFAFSLSLSQESEKIIGGRLGIRRKNQENFLDIPTPSFGGMILFLTGIYGFEHKIHQVIHGKRVIIAGWCS